jgi:transposase InsO family protein
MKELQAGIKKYMYVYNSKRLHSAIDYKSPNEVYFTGVNNLALNEDNLLRKVS